MGTTVNDKNADDNEKPLHKVIFTKPLWVTKYPVTKDQYAAFVREKGHKTVAETDAKIRIYLKPTLIARNF